MQVDVASSKLKVYNIEMFDVVVGEKFYLFTDFTPASRWVSDNDPVLSLEVVGNNAIAEPLQPGTSSILITTGSHKDNTFKVEKEIIINVVDAIINPATDLGLSAINAV